MSERKRGLYGALRNPVLYETVQRAMGAEKLRRDFQRNFVRARPGDRVLDIGCGPARLLAHLPDVEYIGFEPNADYVAQARSAYGSNGTFYVGYFGHEEASSLAPVDIAIVSGVLHHMDDTQTSELFGLLYRVLKPSGRAISVDPVLTAGQNPVARTLIKMDRGKHVRSPEGYQSLARKTFAGVEGQTLAQKFPPYTRFYMTAQMTSGAAT